MSVTARDTGELMVWMDEAGTVDVKRSVHQSAVRAEFFRLIQHFGERGWIAVERFSDPLSARLVFRAEHYRRRVAPLANEGDEMFLTVTEAGGLRIESGGGTWSTEWGN